MTLIGIQMTNLSSIELVVVSVHFLPTQHLQIARGREEINADAL